MKTNVLLGAGLLLAIIGGLAVYMYLNSVSQTAKAAAPPPVNVVVAATTIAPYRPITKEMLTTKAVPAEAVATDNLRDVTPALGKAVSAPLQAGQPVLSSALTEGAFSYAVPKNLRAIAVSVDKLSVLNGLLHDGDYVDVIFTGTMPQINESEGKDGRHADPKAEGPAGKLIVQNVQVLKVQNGATPATAGASPAPAAAGATAADWSVVLAVTPQQAELLRFAVANGTTSLVLRSNGDAANAKTTGVSQQSISKDNGVPLPLQPTK